jgi:hypothetical protein
MFVVSDWIQLSFIHFLLVFLCGTYSLLFHFVLSQASAFVSCQFFTTFCRIQLWNIELLVCVCVCVCARARVRVRAFLEEGVIFHFVCASCINILIRTILAQFSKGL